MAIIGAILAMTATATVVGAAPASAATSRSVDYYQYCYTFNRAPLWYGTTIYAGAQVLDANGVLCKAKVIPNRSAVPWSSSWNAYVTWPQICRAYGYPTVQWVDRRNGALVCAK